MEKTEWLQKAVQAIMETDEEAAKKIASDSLEAGMGPLEMINQGFTEGIRKMGDLFERGEVFSPGLIIASEATPDDPMKWLQVALSMVAFTRTQNTTGQLSI